eukprot:2833840-Rhodomonas_salina.1
MDNEVAKNAMKAFVKVLPKVDFNRNLEAPHSDLQHSFQNHGFQKVMSKWLEKKLTGGDSDDKKETSIEAALNNALDKLREAKTAVKEVLASFNSLQNLDDDAPQFVDLLSDVQTSLSNSISDERHMGKVLPEFKEAFQ